MDFFKKLNLNKLVIYEKILDEIDVGVHAIDKHGRTIIYNKKMINIEGMQIEDVLEKEVMDVFPFKTDKDSTLVQALKQGTTIKNSKQTYFNNKGKEITTVNDTFPIYENNTKVGAIEIAKDITKLEKLIRENVRKKGDTRYTFDHIIGKSTVLKEVIHTSKRATRTSSSVLIIGETGTGKELFAQSIHNGSNRSSSPFISQNCAAIPDSLIESILFGTKKGAFTGATERPGLFEQAQGGTLLLDEINSLNPNLQAKLLRAIQEKRIRRIGDTTDREIDVRIIATMNEDPVDAIANGTIRKDLYYRLSVVSLFIPPLRDRKEDINLLIQDFIEKYNTLFGMEVTGADEAIIEQFYKYDWPGNIRELEHIVEGAMNLIDYEEKLSYTHLPLHFRNKLFKERESKTYHLPAETPSFQPLQPYIQSVEKLYISNVLDYHDNNITQSAKALGMSRQNLQYRIKKLGIIQKEKTATSTSNKVK